MHYSTMTDALAQLQRLSLISKVTQELENNIGIADRTLSEFIISTADEVRSVDEFDSALKAAGAEFDPGLVETLWSVIRRMQPDGGKNESALPSSNKGAAVVGSGKYAGLAKQNDVDLVKQMEAEIIREGAEHIKERNGDLRGRNDNRRDRGRGRDDDRRGDRRGARRDDRGYDRRDDRGYDRRDDRGYDRRDDRRNDGYISRDGRDRSRRDEKHHGDKPVELHGVYEGRVTKLVDFGCFVELDVSSREPQREGLVHVSNMSTRKVRPQDIVDRGDQVWVKVISLTNNRIGLSMRDVDQKTGEDFLAIGGGFDGSGFGDNVRGRAEERSSLYGLSGIDAKSAAAIDNGGRKKRRKRMTSPERFEIQQLIKSGVVDPSEYPDIFQEDEPEEFATEEDFEIDLNDAEPLFLKGVSSRSTGAVSPVRVVKNPDGSLQRAAMTQGALAKERREIQQQQQRTVMDAIPKDLSKPWQDPMASGSDRAFVEELRGVGLQQQEMPEWKKASLGKAPTFGIQDTRSIKEQRETLPIFTLRDALLSAVHDNQVLVVIGETGSGKTTQMTQYLAEAGYTSRGRIGCTQPRRVAAMSVAKRVAEEVGCRLGEEVGYAIRFEDCTSSSTVIKYMTDGMLLREALLDDSLAAYSVLILDEAHERTIHTDVLFGLLKGILSRRKDLKVIVTSATLDADKFSGYFFGCPIFTIPGRTFPVEIMYTKEPESDYVDAALITVMQIHLTEPEGDILLFLTGQDEIDTAAQVLYERTKALGPAVPELIILPVYSSLPSEMQSRIFDPAPPGSRKVIIATNIAEASLTIDGIYYVVDPGFSKQKVYNPKIGMDSLVVSPISQASASQRSGRAGRTGPGKCYRLYTESAFNDEMLPTTVPEIQRSNLSMTVLTMKAMGINDLLNFDFMDPPPPQTLVTALEQLYNLGALDEEGLLTKLGRKMAEFPLDPPVSKMLIASVDLGCSEEIVTIIGMLSAQNIFHRPRDKQAAADQRKSRFSQPEGDHLTMLAVYDAWKTASFSVPWCYENFIQARSMRRAQDVRKQLITIMDRYKLDLVSAGSNWQKIQMAVTSGFFFHAAKKDPQEGYKTLVEQQAVSIHPGSALFQQQPDWVVYHELVMTTREYMRECTVIDPKWLVELAPRFFKAADKNKLSRRKRSERIEPLFDRFNPNSQDWRLSRRQG